MKYLYKCTNLKCKVKLVEINKPMKDSSRIEHCEQCKKELTRQYNFGISTADGFKS